MNIEKKIHKVVRAIKLFDNMHNIILYIVLHKQFEQHCHK